MESFSAAVLSYGITHDVVRGYALNIWDVLISGSNKSLTDAFNNLNHNETFGLGGYVKKNHVPTTFEILSSLWNKNNRAALIEFIKANQWSDGIRKRDNLPSLNKYILALTIDLAVFIKKILSQVLITFYSGHRQMLFFKVREGANKQVISSPADSLIKISRIWADFFPQIHRISR